MPFRLPGQPCVGTAAGIVRRFARDLKPASSRRGDGCLLNDGIHCAIPGPSLSIRHLAVPGLEMGNPNVLEID